MNEHYFSHDNVQDSINLHLDVTKLKKLHLTMKILITMIMSIIIFWDATRRYALTFQRNVITHLPVYRALHARRQLSSSTM